MPRRRNVKRKRIYFTAYRRGKKVKVWFEIHKGYLMSKAGQTKKETLDESMRNLDEHENLPDRLLKIEKKLDDLGLGSSINFILLMIIFLYLLFFGGVLL